MRKRREKRKPQKESLWIIFQQKEEKGSSFTISAGASSS